MKRMILMLTLAAMLVVALTVTAAPSFAQITQSTNNGHPDTNPAGNCPQNQDLNPGAAKKCKNS